MSNNYVKCAAVLDTLISEGAALLARHGEDTATAERGGKDFAFCVLTYFSAQKVYFPKFTYDAARKKMAAISEDVQQNRQSAAEIVKIYGITMTLAYQIIKQTRNLAANGQDAHYVVKGIAIEAARMLMKYGVAPSDAVVAARGLAGVLVAKWSGQHLSFPRLEIIKAQKRYDDIIRQYCADVPCAEIASRYGLSFVRVYQVINDYCRKSGIESPSVKNRSNTLGTLKIRILEVAASYSGKSAEICGLLESAADTIGRAQKKTQETKLYKEEQQ
jgi:Mor family transcriptional regulator